MEYLSVLFSIVLLGCIAVLLLSCASCKRIFKKKDDSDKDVDEEKAEVIQENEKEEKKKETGVANQAYTETPHQNGGDNVVVENEEETGTAEDQKDDKAVEDRPDENNGEATTDVEESSSERAAVNLNTNNSGTNSAAAEEQQGEDEENAEVTTNSVSGCNKDHDQACTEVDSPITKSNIHTFSKSIRSNDVADLSVAIDGLHEPIENDTASSFESAPVLSVIQEQDFEKYKDVVIPGGWRRNVKLTDLLEMGLISTDDADEVLSVWQESNPIDETSLPPALKPYLYGESPVAGIILSETDEKKSIFRAAKDGILRRGAAISFLEAQAATGNMIDPLSGRKMSVAEACELGLLDKVYETVVSRAERAVTGYKSKALDDTLSLGQAIERGLVMESHGIRLLEAQLATGGVIDHKANIKLPVDIAIKRGILDEKLAAKFSIITDEGSQEQNHDRLKTFVDPNTEENVTYQELMKRSIVEEETGIRLYPLERVGRKRLSYGSYSGRSSLASSRASSKESIPAAVAASPLAT